MDGCLFRGMCAHPARVALTDLLALIHFADSPSSGVGPAQPVFCRWFLESLWNSP